MDQYHHGNLRAALLKAASQLVAKSGVEGLTLREAARKAGVSHNAPYRHFSGKEDLLAALATDALQQLHQSLQKAVHEAGPGEKLRRAARAYLHFSLANPSRFQVMFHSSFDREAYADYVAAYTESLSLVTALLQEELGRAASTREDADTAAEIIWSAIHGIAELGIAKRLREGDARELEHLADTTIGILARGLRTTGESES